MARNSSSGANSDCTELYKDAKRFSALVTKALSKCETDLLELCKEKHRLEYQQQQSSSTGVGKLKSQHNVEPMLEAVRTCTVKIVDLEKRFQVLARDEKSCKKTLFFRARHVIAQLEKKKFSATLIVHKYIKHLLNFVAGRNAQNPADWLYVLQSIDGYNSFLGDFDIGQRHVTKAAATSVSLIHAFGNRSAHIHENFTPTHFLQLKPISSSKILQALAAERAKFAAVEVIRSITHGFEVKQLELAAEEVSWLTLPVRGDKDMKVEPLNHAAGHKSKSKGGGTLPAIDGGNDGDSPTSDYHSQNGSGSSHFSIIDEFVGGEERFVNAVCNNLAEVPGLLGKQALHVVNKSSQARLTRGARVRMSEYYHDHLWHAVGSVVEKSLLWGIGDSGSNYPFALQHPRVALGLSNLLQDNLYAKFGDGYAPVVYPCMQLLVEGLNLHAVASSWDIQFLNCLSESSRQKNVVVEVSGMRSGTVASKTGKLFYDTLKSIVRLNNRCHPDMLRDFVEHGHHDPEEYPFTEELSALRRLFATLYSLRNWAGSRSHATLQSWQVQDFLLITQGDLLNVDDCFNILQLENHERMLLAKSINIQLFAHLQGAVSKEIQTCIKTIRGSPGEEMVAMGKMCRTVSLATLQNVFPLEKYWRQHTNTLPTNPSLYVQEYIDRVLAPVFVALKDMKIEIQQNVARISIKSFCEAWLEHIRTSKIKFSEWGAQQISVDFQALRNWIGSNDLVHEDSRRYLLLLDSIRQCEGVAKVLKAKPGEIVDVKPSKNKVSPMIESDESRRPDSPVNQILDAIPAELYVPNQQQWIGHKANSKLLSIPFCCR